MRRIETIAACTVLTLVVTVADAGPLRTVALSSKPAAGATDDAAYQGFASFFAVNMPEVFRGPVINDLGQAAFRADLTGSGVDIANNQGIWSEGSGNLALVARTGSPAPGAPEGVNFGLNLTPQGKLAQELFVPILNNAGHTAFFGGLTDGTVGLWVERSDGLALVARDGTPAPGVPEDAELSFEMLRGFVPDLPRLNDAGQTSFWGTIKGAGINNTNDWGVWAERNGELQLVARSGNPAPGMPEGVLYDSLIVRPSQNDAGELALWSFVRGSGVTTSNDQGIWAERSGDLVLVARSGDAAPGAPTGANFRDFFIPVTINNSGRVAFAGWLTGEGVDETNDEGLWSDGGDTLALVARRGSPAPGTPAGVNFDVFSDGSAWPVMNDAGQTAFRANLAGTGVNSTNDRGIWLGDSEDLALVARKGDPAPGTPSGVRFSNLSRPTLNYAGQIAFRGDLTGTGVSSGNNLGIWASDTTGALQLIVRKGAQLEVAPGDFRTISDLGFVTDSANNDGRASAFNDLGQLVFWARFTNGTQGVFVSNLVANFQTLPGDYNNDGFVDAADYVVWRSFSDQIRSLPGEHPDAATPGIVDEEDYHHWRANFGATISGAEAVAKSIAALAVPEPAGGTLAAIGLGLFLVRRFRRKPYRRGCTFAHRSGRVGIVCALTAGAAVAFGPANTLLASTNGFDESAKSPAVIPFDPEATFEARAGFVSSKLFTSVKGPLVDGININTLLGADAFYNQGHTGTNAVIASIEPGHIWSGHETLAHVQQIPNHPTARNEFDRHNTQVGMILGGRRGGENPGAYQEGMAPDAQLFSGAMATQWNGRRYTVNFSDSNTVTFDQYRKAFATGVDATGRTADVINSSWQKLESSTSNGSDTVSIALDGFANANPRTLFVVSAGNDGPGANKVLAPASAYNNMSVAALGRNPRYDRPASFSSGGPNNYSDPINGTKTNARQVVDIAAPGENLSSAYYGGETGGNGMGLTGLPIGLPGGPDYYNRGGLAGTSFSAPVVAGGAALLYDAAYSVFPDNGDARDARVMKAVLMNSADKTFGWNNGQVSHPNGNGGVLTMQALDNRVGTGSLNLAAAYDQFLGGSTDVAGTSSGELGFVNDIGWDFGQVVSGTTNDYFFDSQLDAGSTMSATLSWFRDRRINDSNTVFDDSYDDLNLELWSVVDGTLTSLISESSSLYNNSEHFTFSLPNTGDYALRVRWFKEVFDRINDADQEFYGLAWSVRAALEAVAVPEPASEMLLVLALTAFGGCRRTLRKQTLRDAPSTAAT